MAKKANIKRIGKWDVVQRMFANLLVELSQTRHTFLTNVGLQGEKIIVGHIANQDLGWEPLASATVEAKKRQGLSNLTLVATSTYFQNVTSHVKGGTLYIGVKRNISTKSSKGGNKQKTDLDTVAAIHEFGFGNVPARPLWEPGLKEIVDWAIKNEPPSPSLKRRLIRYK